jgi:probable F420-dependent oxidoreductase
MTLQKRPFRFGAVIHGARSREDWRNQASKIEDLGYSTILAPDHFEMVDISPTIALMAAAEATSELRVGSFVFNNDLRHPTVLAKDIATLDLLSSGRCEWGLGAGYLPDDYEKAGIALEPPGVRIERMEEALGVIKGFFSDEPVSFSGKYYTVRNLNGLPKPLQKPYPPLYIGGGGKRVLSFAAREADIVGFTAILKPGGTGFQMTDITAEATAQKAEWVREAAGARFHRLEINSFVFSVKVTDHREVVADHAAAYMGLTGEQVLASPHCLIGTTEQICEDLHIWRERYGISYFSILGDENIDALGPVISHLKGM